MPSHVVKFPVPGSARQAVFLAHRFDVVPLTSYDIHLASVERGVLCAATIVANPRYGGYFLLNLSKFYCPLVSIHLQEALHWGVFWFS